MSSPTQLSSFDPAIHLHSTQDIPSDFFSDIDAAREVGEEVQARNKQEGIVIQHRSWKADDVFWSEPDRSGGELVLQLRLVVWILIVAQVRP